MEFKVRYFVVIRVIDSRKDKTGRVEIDIPWDIIEAIDFIYFCNRGADQVLDNFYVRPSADIVVENVVRVTRHNIKRKEFFIAAGACNDNGFPLGPNSDPNDARHFYKVIVVSVHINFTFFLRQLCLKGVLIVGDNLFRQIEKILFKLRTRKQ